MEIALPHDVSILGSSLNFTGCMDIMAMLPLPGNIFVRVR